MGFLFSSSKKNQIPEITGLQIQTAVNTVPIAICYGTPKVPMNIFYANGFKSVKQKSGGKGFLSGSKGDITGYKYYATWIGGLCEGPLSGTIISIWEDQKVYNRTTIPQGVNFAMFPGYDNVDPWPVIETNWPQDARSYKDTAYVGFDNCEIDSSATIPQWNFLIQAIFATTFPLHRYTTTDNATWLFDADPALCIEDFLINKRYGAGFPSSYIDDSTLTTSSNGLDPDVGDAAVSTYCQAVGMGWSICLNSSEPASSILNRWLKNLVVAPVWTGTQLKFIPYCDSKFSTNPNYDTAKADVGLKYYTPNISPLFSLDDSDYLQSETSDEDPITLSRVDPRDAMNIVRVGFQDRDNEYNNNSAEAKDELAVELYGARIDSSNISEEFTLLDYASQSAQMQLQRNMSVRNTGTFRLGPQWCFLEPMDILTITDETQNLIQFPVRITSIEEDEKGVLAISFEEFRAGSMQPTIYKKQANSPPNLLYSTITAPSINDPIILEPTHELLVARGESNPTVMVALSGGPSTRFDPNWGGADIWLSIDNVTYDKRGTVTSPSNMGYTASTLPSYLGGNPDTVDTLSVDLTESEGSLVSVTSTAAATGASLCAIVEDDGTYELIGYTTALLVAPNQYQLSGLYRDMYGTQACEHGANSKFVRLDSLITEIPLQTSYIGTKIFAKFPSFNIYGQGNQDLSQATFYTYTPSGYGIGIASNPLALALQSPGPYIIDLGSFYTSATFDLGAIGGECAPISFKVDLESV